MRVIYGYNIFGCVFHFIWWRHTTFEDLSVVSFTKFFFFYWVLISFWTHYCVNSSRSWILSKFFVIVPCLVQCLEQGNCLVIFFFFLNKWVERMNGLGWHSLKPMGFVEHRIFNDKPRNSQANQGVTLGISKWMHFPKETKVETQRRDNVPRPATWSLVNTKPC